MDEVTNELVEHCDAILIMTSMYNEGETRSWWRWMGNQHAISGMCMEMIVRLAKHQTESEEETKTEEEE